MPVKRPLIELTYYDTYYFANFVKDILEDQFSYLRLLDDFYGDCRYLSYTSPFPRFSAFHSFIRFLVDALICDDVLNIKLDMRQDEAERFKSMPSALNAHPSKLPVNLALDRFGIQHQTFDSWLNARGIEFLDARDADVEEYYEDLRTRGQMGELLDRTTAEVFLSSFRTGMSSYFLTK